MHYETYHLLCPAMLGLESLAESLAEFFLSQGISLPKFSQEVTTEDKESLAWHNSQQSI
jgi:hypothetical protein